MQYSLLPLAPDFRLVLHLRKMVPTASGRCLPFLVASADHQGTLRFKICEVDSMVASERQKERVGRLLAADLAIAGASIISL